MEYRNLCKNCGGDLRKVSDTHYACVHCNAVYATEKIETYAEKMHRLFDASKLELISNARKNLYKAISDKYISSKAVHDACVEIKKYLPDDYQANFYDSFLNNTSIDNSKMIRKVNVKENFESLELMLTFLIKSLEQEFVLDVAALIERAYKSSSFKNLVKYDEYATKLSNEAQKIDDWMYVTDVPRDVFVAYSSEDIDKVLDLVDELENNQGLQCFISIRNLRHGAGSRENYNKALQEAMDNCKSFVFVSSKNSRRQGCDAFKVEIPYIKKKDMERASHLGYLNYEAIPLEIKTPRVEYRLNDSEHKNAADIIVDEFFSGWERVYTPIEVAERVMRQTSPVQVSTPTDSAAKAQPKNKAEPKPTPKKVKFCVSCFSKCNEDMEQCDVCGETNFASSLNEAKKLNREEKERQKKKEKIEKTKEKNKNHKEKVERKKAPKKIKEPRQKILSKNIASVIAWFFAIIVVGALVALGFVFVNLRPWLIASAIGVAYAFLSTWIGKKTKLAGYIFLSVCMSIANIILVHFSGMFEYALCFSIALIIPMVVKGKNYISDFDVAAYVFAFIGAILLVVSIGSNYIGLTKALVVGCGIGVAFIIFSIKESRDETDAFYPLLIIFGILLFILMWRNYFFTIFSICALVGGIISGFIYAKVDEDIGTLLGGFGIFIVVLALINIWLFEPKAGNELIIKKGELKTYAGTQEVVVIPQEVTTINNNAFQFSAPQNNLKEVVLHNKITSIGKSAFIDCDGLETVTIPGSVKTVSNKAFNGCDNIKTVALENGIETIGKKAFYKCKSLKDVMIPGSVKMVDKQAFGGCDNLKTVTFENGVTTIGEKAFYKCRNLEKIIIPISITSIGDAAFRECNKLSKIYYAGTEENWNNISKDWWISTGDEYCEYEIIYNYVPNATDTKSAMENVEASEPAMYCVLPEKNKEIIPIA